MVKNSTQWSTEEPQAQTPIIRTRSTKGLFDVDGWKCNCDPRLPAVRCTAMKKNNNYGRQYYKCSNADTGCKFFLWESDALPRESHLAPKPLPEQACLSLPPTPLTGSRRHTRANPAPENVVETPFKRRISEDFTSDTEPDSERDEDVEPYMNWREPSRFPNGGATPRKQQRTDTQSSPSKSNNVRLYQSRLPYGPGEASSSSNTRHALSQHPVLAPPAATTTGHRRISPRLHPETANATAQTPSRPHPSVSSSSDNLLTTNPVRRTLFGPRPRTPSPQPRPAYTPVTPGSRKIGSPGRGLQDTLIADTFKLLDRNRVNLAAFSADLRAVLMRHVMQKEGISQGRDSLRQTLARKDLEVAGMKVKLTEMEGRNVALERESGRMLEKGGQMEAEVARMRVRVGELEGKNEILEREKGALMEEKARMLEEEKEMKAKMASLTSTLQRMQLSQTPQLSPQLPPQLQFGGVTVDTAYLNIS